MENFRKYATRRLGTGGTALGSYMNISGNYISPTIIEEQQLNIAQMDVFSRSMMDHIILLDTQTDDYTANVIQAQLLYLDSGDPGKGISIYISSPGGPVYTGYDIYDTMQFISSDVSTIYAGMAASMASVLLVVGAKGGRFGLKHSHAVIRQPLGGVQGQTSDIKITVHEILKVKKELYTIISGHSGRPYEGIERDDDRDFWMAAEETKKYDMIDDVLTRK